MVPLFARIGRDLDEQGRERKTMSLGDVGIGGAGE